MCPIYLGVQFSTSSELVKEGESKELENFRPETEETLLKLIKAFSIGRFFRCLWGMELCTNQECIVECQESLKIWICFRLKNAQLLVQDEPDTLSRNFLSLPCLSSQLSKVTCWCQNQSSSLLWKGPCPGQQETCTYCSVKELGSFQKPNHLLCQDQVFIHFSRRALENCLQRERRTFYREKGEDCSFKWHFGYFSKVPNWKESGLLPIHKRGCTKILKLRYEKPKPLRLGGTCLLCFAGFHHCHLFSKKSNHLGSIWIIMPRAYPFTGNTKNGSVVNACKSSKLATILSITITFVMYF